MPNRFHVWNRPRAGEFRDGGPNRPRSEGSPRSVSPLRGPALRAKSDPRRQGVASVEAGTLRQSRTARQLRLRLETSDSRLAGCAPSETRINRRRATTGRATLRGASNGGGGCCRAGSCCWCRPAMPRCCSRWRGSATAIRSIRSDPGCDRWSTAWRWRSTAPGPSTARSARGALRHRLPADLPGSDAAAPVRLAHPRANGAGGAGQNTVSIADFIASRYGRSQPLALVATSPDRGGALPGAAVQGGGDQPGRARRPGPVGTGARRPGAVRGRADGAVRDPVRHPPGRCHRAPPGHDAGGGAGVAGEAGRAGRGRAVRLRLARRARPGLRRRHPLAARGRAAGGLRETLLAFRRSSPAPPVPRRDRRMRHVDDVAARAGCSVATWC